MPTDLLGARWLSNVWHLPVSTNRLGATCHDPSGSSQYSVRLAFVVPSVPLAFLEFEGNHRDNLLRTFLHLYKMKGGPLPHPQQNKQCYFCPEVKKQRKIIWMAKIVDRENSNVWYFSLHIDCKVCQQQNNESDCIRKAKWIAATNEKPHTSFFLECLFYIVKFFCTQWTPLHFFKRSRARGRPPLAMWIRCFTAKEISGIRP